MRSDEDKLKKYEELALELDAALPTRVWVEGDGKMYGDFQGNSGRRVQLTPFEAIQLIHQAAATARRMISL